MDVGLGRGWPFPIANILCFLSSKSGLKGCVYGQVAGEVCGSLYALEEGGLPDLPLPLPLLGAVLGPQATLGLSSYALSLFTLRATAQSLLGPGPRAPWGLVISLSSPPCPTVQLSVGPMARDVESLALCLRALLCEDMFHLDPSVPPLPFREEVSRGGGGHGVDSGLTGAPEPREHSPHCSRTWRPCLLKTTPAGPGVGWGEGG